MKKYQYIKHPAFVGAVACFCCLLWGSAFPAVKVGYTLLHIDASDTWTQILFAGLRFAAAGLLTILFGSLPGRKFLLPKPASFGKIGLLAIVQTVLQYIAFYIGLSMTTAVKSSIIEGASSFIAILIACFVFQMERFNLPKCIGCVLGLSGIVIVNLNGGGLGSFSTYKGDILMLIAASAYALSSVLLRRFSKSENPVVLSGYQFFFGGIVMSVAAFAGGGRIVFDNIGGVLLLLYLSALSAVAYTLWGILLKYNDVSSVSIYGFMIPVFGVMLSALFIDGEAASVFRLQTIIALVLVCAGIIIVNHFGDKERVKA